MIARLRGVLGATGNENPSIVGLDRAEPNWDVEVDVQELARFLVLIDVVESHHPLIKFEKVDSAGSLSLLLHLGETIAVDVTHRPLHRGLLLAKYIVEGSARVDNRPSPAELDVRLQRVSALSESQIASRFTSVAPIEVHLDVRSVLRLLTYRIKVVSPS